MFRIAQSAPLVSAEGLPCHTDVNPLVEINIPFRVSWWVCSEIDITDNSIIVTHARDYVDLSTTSGWDVKSRSRMFPCRVGSVTI